MRHFIWMALVLASIQGLAQKKTKGATPARKPLTHDVYNHWKEIPYKAITADGNFAATAINPQEGDGKVVFYNLNRPQQDSVARAADITLTYDGQYAVFRIKPPFNLVKDLRRQKKKKEDLPKDSLGIYHFATRATQKVADVRSFKVPERSGGWVAYLREARKEKDNKDNAAKAKTEGTKAPADTTRKKDVKVTKKPKKNSDDNGYTLVLQQLGGKSTSFGYVKDYAFARYGQALMFTSTGNDSTMKAGVYWYDLGAGQLTMLYEGRSKQKFRNLAVSDDGLQALFIADLDTTKALKRYPKLLYWKKGDATASVLADEKTAPLPKQWVVSEHQSPYFSRDSKVVYAGFSPEPVQQDTTLLPEEIVNVEVWGWRDEVLYPQQNKQLDNEKKRSYLAAIHPADKKVVLLAGLDMPAVELADEGNAPVALVTTNIPYRWSNFYDVNVASDAYVVNIQDGSRTLAAAKVKGDVSISPKGKYLFWFSLSDTAWFSYNIAQRTTVRLTQGLRVRFADEEDDHPDYPGTYGFIGWLAGDEKFLAYDRYDIWAFDPDNKTAPVNLTQNGRTSRTTFRYVRLDPEERFIKADQVLLLSAFHEQTKQRGYYQLSLKDKTLKPLLMSDHRYSVTIKARQADRLLYTRENFREFPDVWTTNLQFQSPRRITDANPQMQQYHWGSVELVRWTSLDNIPLQGLLYKPDNFDPKKKYPMMVYFYEKYADDIHNHYAPAPIRSIINFSMYTSNGYLVFVPDIVYKIGFPGESAHNCILPGVTSLIAQGFVDEKHIGVQGHSWGGYQTAYLVTRTNMFAAAEAGAPVSNMTSAYGGIRWESGLSRMFQYEHSQSRIGGTLWETPIRYIENSPIFFADKVQTPLLMMHNDADGAVPWYQGIEYYMALRRLNKPVWMLNYNNQGHGLSQRQDRTDFAIRMMQFFDHYLKGAPMPPWMKQGIPAIEKGINKGY